MSRSFLRLVILIYIFLLQLEPVRYCDPQEIIFYDPFTGNL